MLSVLADILGIISFFLSIALLVYSEALRKQIGAQKLNYKKEQKDIRIALMGHRNTVWEDRLLSRSVRSEMRTSLLTYMQNYRYVLSLIDIIRIRKTVRMLRQPDSRIDLDKLCLLLDRLIARFARRES